MKTLTPDALIWLMPLEEIDSEVTLLEVVVAYLTITMPEPPLPPILPLGVVADHAPPPPLLTTADHQLSVA